MASDGIICQGCGIEAPVKNLAFYQNIGMLVARRTSFIKGNLCKSCAHSHFWKKTGVTIAVGWLGTISLIMAPIFVLMNTVHYVRALFMAPVPPNACRPTVDNNVVDRLARFQPELASRLNSNEPLNAVARDMTGRAGVTPGQIVVFVQWLAQQSRKPQVEKTYGFPVQPARAAAPVPVIPLESAPTTAKS